MPPPAHYANDARGRGITSVHWFRHGLRLHDNPALLEALKNCSDFYPVFIFDGEVAGSSTAGFNRMRFLLECLKDLDSSLKNHGGRLYVFFGDPVKIFENLFEEWGVSKLTFEEDPEPIWKARDNAVKNLCADKNVECIERVSHNLWDPKEVINNNGGSPPLTYMLFNQVAQLLGDPPRPVSDPDFSDLRLPVAEDHDNKYGIRSLEKMGIFPECMEQTDRVNNWKGGETQGLSNLKKRLDIEEMAFKTGAVMPNQAFPNLLGPPMSMSPHLRFGCLSIRKFYWSLRDTYNRVHEGKRDITVSAVGQLIWREYFYTMSVNNIHYNKMFENPICLNIPWYSDDAKLKRWTEGTTGYPWIDAIMKQLHHEGWIHHVCRHAVSCFLTRGDLWISWEEGLKVFDKLLLDADWSVCAGNWMWMSSSAFEKVFQCPKCFCPVRYGRRMDPTGAYIRRYLPVLKDMPLRYLFEPWTAPKAVQEKAQCIIGVDYPSPIVEHQKASKQCRYLMNEVRDKLLQINNVTEIQHCAPASREEVRQFCWLPGSHREDHAGTASSQDMEHICDGLVGI